MNQSESADAFGGVPDEFQRLWTPHRLVYIETGTQPTDCPFCAAPDLSDEQAVKIVKYVLQVTDGAVLE